MLRGEPREDPLPRNTAGAPSLLPPPLCSTLSSSNLRLFIQDLNDLMEMLNGIHVRQPASKARLLNSRGLGVPSAL